MKTAAAKDAKLRLWQASDKLFAVATDLSPHLDRHPTATLAILAACPDHFGLLRASLDGKTLEKALKRVVAAAEDYVATVRDARRRNT